jgi:short-subunit dehydrogenase
MPFQHLLITGASSGLGAALAREAARPGAVLHLGGRRAEALEAVAADCAARGAAVTTRLVDVRDAGDMSDWIGDCGRLDLVIANAGIGGGTGAGTEGADTARRIFETNVTGVLNTALPAIAVMARQEPGEDGWRGHVATIASLAAFVAGPSAPAYCAAKSAVQRWTEARDASERRRGIRLHAVCPGFIRTPMTAENPFPMPLLMDAEDAARRTLRGIARGRLRIAYPWPLYALARVTGALPPGLRNRLMGVAPPKPAGSTS